MKLEFFYYKDSRTNAAKMDLINSTGNVLATLDYHDFKRMNDAGKSEGELQNVVDYCNKYKGTDIADFTPTVF